ncbi:MAG: outer membrane lipoprotein-sorting protein [bacterium]
MKDSFKLLAGATILIFFCAAGLAVSESSSSGSQEASQPSSQGPKEILKKTLDRDYEDLKLHVKLTKISRTGREREMELDVYIKESEEVTKTLVEFTSPPAVKGMSSLSWNYADKPADRWFKLLGMNYVKCLGEACQRMEERFGFSMEIFSIDINEAKHELLGTEEIDGAPCYKIESEAVEDNPEGSRFITWVDQKMYAARKIEAYNEEGEKTQVSRFTGFDKIGDRFWETKGTLEKLDSGKEVRFEIVSHELNTGLSDELFERPKSFEVRKD